MVAPNTAASSLPINRTPQVDLQLTYLLRPFANTGARRPADFRFNLSMDPPTEYTGSEQASTDSGPLEQPDLSEEEMVLIAYWRGTTPSVRHSVLYELRIDYSSEREATTGTKAYQPVFSFEHSRNPKHLINCAVKVDRDPVVGSLIPGNSGGTEELQWKLFFDYGKVGPPCLKLKIKRHNKELASVTWGFEDCSAGQWAITPSCLAEVADPTDYEELANNAEIDRQYALASQNRNPSLYVSRMMLKVYNSTNRYISQEVRSALQIDKTPDATIHRIWVARSSYRVAIWYSAPQSAMVQGGFEVLDDLFNQRMRPLFLAKDRTGNYFYPLRVPRCASPNRGHVQGQESAIPLPQPDNSDQSGDNSKNLADQASQEAATTDADRLDSHKAGPKVAEGVISNASGLEDSSLQRTLGHEPTSIAKDAALAKRPAFQPNIGLRKQVDPILAAALR